MMLLVTSASRVHAHTIEAPDAVTQEVNRCLRLVRLTASRRNQSALQIAERHHKRATAFNASL